jgi:DnaK suppressor protein
MTPARKGAPAKKAPASRTAAAKKTAATKQRPPARVAAATKKRPATPVKRTTAPAKKSAPIKKSAASVKKATTTKTAKKSAPAAKKTAPAKKAAAPAKKAPVAAKTAKAAGAAAAATKEVAPPRTTFTRKPIPPAPVRPKAGPYGKDLKFLEEVKEILYSERAVYQEQATSLRAEADSLALEREPGDVQFDEESGEGGTVTVDRERNLALSGQALLAVEEIDDALKRIEDKTYGYCERCFQPVPKPRLRALPYARLCVACKSGGLSRR